MENKNSYIDDILSQWNLKSIDFDTYVESYDDKNLIVDIYPFEIENPEKNCQVEVFYRRFLDKNIPRNQYFDYEQRYLNFVKYLWMYNATDVFYDLLFDNYFRKGLKKYKTIRKKIQISEEIQNADSWYKIEELLIMALREAGYIFLHFKDWNIVLMINDFSILVLCKEKQTTLIIKDFAMNSGLFVRLCKKK